MYISILYKYISRVTEHNEHLYLQTFVSYDITEWPSWNDSYWINISNCLSLLPKHNTAVTIQVKFELCMLWECFVAQMTLTVEPVLCDVAKWKPGINYVEVFIYFSPCGQGELKSVLKIGQKCFLSHLLQHIMLQNANSYASSNSKLPMSE
jgi:hypothetical protein